MFHFQDFISFTLRPVIKVKCLAIHDIFFLFLPNRWQR